LALSLDGLRTNVYDLFQLNSNVQYLITYADEDNDVVEEDPSNPIAHEEGKPKNWAKN
jgi:hypothetical protein